MELTAQPVLKEPQTATAVLMITAAVTEEEPSAGAPIELVRKASSMLLPSSIPAFYLWKAVELGKSVVLKMGSLVRLSIIDAVGTTCKYLSESKSKRGQD